jgi:hypothetical protein
VPDGSEVSQEDQDYYRRRMELKAKDADTGDRRPFSRYSPQEENPIWWHQCARCKNMGDHRWPADKIARSCQLNMLAIPCAVCVDQLLATLTQSDYEVPQSGTST